MFKTGLTIPFTLSNTFSVLGLSSKNNKIILDGGNLYIKWLEDKTVTLTGMTERVFEGILEY